MVRKQRRFRAERIQVVQNSSHVEIKEHWMGVDMFMGLLAVIVIVLLIRLVGKQSIQRFPALTLSPNIKREV